MKRREAIRNVILVSAGAAFLYACKEKGEVNVLDELTETIIPGIKDIKSGDFILLMVDDCMPLEAQQKFSAGMKAFVDNGFIDMSPEERRTYIDKLDGDAKDFFNMVRRGTIENFTTSKDFLENVKHVTSLIPAKFQPCVTVNA
jgi:hypothetical protein